MPASGHGRDASPAVLALAVTAIAAVELALIRPGHELAGQIADAVLVLVLANAGWRRTGPRVVALRALVLLPLARVIALGMPLRRWSDAVDLLLIAVPMALAAFRLAPAVRLDLRAVAAARAPWVRLGTAAAGAALGLLVYLLGGTVLLPVHGSTARVVVAVAASVAAAATEELVFRGLVQMTLQRVAARAGIVVASALFAATYAGAGSAALVLAFALAGLVFAGAVARTGALDGAIAGHVALALGAAVVWPALLGHSPPTWLDGRRTTVALALAVAVAAATALAAGRPAVPEASRRPRARPLRRSGASRLLLGTALVLAAAAVLVLGGIGTAPVLAADAALLVCAAGLLGSGAARAVDRRRRSRAGELAEPAGERSADGSSA